MFHCHRCRYSFHSLGAFNSHIFQPHHLCQELGCGLEFATEEELEQHWIRDPLHTVCQVCLSWQGYDHDELYQHLFEHHSYCSSCRKVHPNDGQLRLHYVLSDRHFYCILCDRHFMSQSNLNSHFGSSVHLPKDHVCPFKGFDRAFVSMSALILHLESGTCRSGMNRTKVNEVVTRLDRNHIITDPSRLLTGGSNTNNTTVTFSANERAWNGYMYECYLCSNTFRTLAGLNLHLASPKHQEKIYICPSWSCRTKFSTLSALWQHVESEKCGVARFEGVRKAMEGILGGMKQLTL